MQKRVLVVGLGIAGMSAAIGLRQAGWTAIIVERAPERRTGGYFLNLLPQGLQAARDLGVEDHLQTRDPTEGRTWALHRNGGRKPIVGFLDLPGHPSAVVRGDVEAALWATLCETSPGQESVEVRFATAPVDFVERGAGVEVLLRSLEDGEPYRETFDLVVGADGMRSSVREIVFGPHESFVKNWNAMICAFQLREQVQGFESEDSAISARPGRAAWVFGLADHAPTALLTYRTEDIDAQFSGDRIERLRTVFEDMDDPVVRHLLDSLEDAPDYLFDSVHQVKMPRWSKGRVVLLGDSAWCLNLYSGVGATSALRGGAELSRALRKNPGDVFAALTAWEARMRPFIMVNQRTARLKQQMFVPSGRVSEVMRSFILDFAERARSRKVAKQGQVRAGGASSTLSVPAKRRTT